MPYNDPYTVLGSENCAIDAAALTRAVNHPGMAFSCFNNSCEHWLFLAFL